MERGDSSAVSRSGRGYAEEKIGCVFDVGSRFQLITHEQAAMRVRRTPTPKNVSALRAIPRRHAGCDVVAISTSVPPIAALHHIKKMAMACKAGRLMNNERMRAHMADVK